MIVLGLLLILLAVGATIFAVAAPSATSTTIVVTALGVKVSASPLAMFVAGAVSVVLLVLAYVLISRGTRRKARSRKELRQLRKEQAAAGTSPSAEGGHRSRRSDRHENDSHASASPDVSSDRHENDSHASASPDVSSDPSSGSGAVAGTTADNTKAERSDRRQESEPPSST